MSREIRFVQVSFDEHPVYYQELAGLHDDTKPTGNVATGSLFLEVDTGDVYAFAEGNTPSWNKIAALGGDSQ